MSSLCACAWPDNFLVLIPSPKCSDIHAGDFPSVQFFGLKFFGVTRFLFIINLVGTGDVPLKSS